MTTHGRSGDLIAIVVYKGITGSIEVVLGLSALISSLAYGIVGHFFDLSNFFNLIAAGELREDPNDFFANWLIAQNPVVVFKASLNVGLVLVVLGILKIILAVGIWRKSWLIRNIAVVVLSLSAVFMLRDIVMHWSFLRFAALLIDMYILYYCWVHLPRHFRHS